MNIKMQLITENPAAIDASSLHNASSLSPFKNSKEKADIIAIPTNQA